MRPVDRILYTERPEDHWEKFLFFGRTVLDLGCGRWTEGISTADWFLQNGAASMMAVDSDIEEILWLQAQHPEIDAFMLNIQCEEDVERIYASYRPEAVKCDIEGAEEYLFQLPDFYFCIPFSYAIETHTPELLDRCADRLQQAGYEITYLMELDPFHNIHVVFAQRLT